MFHIKSLPEGQRTQSLSLLIFKHLMAALSLKKSCLILNGKTNQTLHSLRDCLRLLTVTTLRFYNKK